MRHFHNLIGPRSAIHLLWVVFCAMPGYAATPPPCHFLLKSDATQYCVSVKVENGFITLIPGTGKIKIEPGFASGRLVESEILEQLASYLQMILDRRRLYEFAQDTVSNAADGNPNQPRLSEPPADAKQLSADSLLDAITNLKKLWPECPDCDNLPDKAIKRLPDLCPASSGGETGCGLEFETPLFRPQIPHPEQSYVLMLVDPIFENASKVKISFDNGTPQGGEEGKLLNADTIKRWLQDNYLGRFWIQKEIEDHFVNLYLDVGISPTIAVSSAGKARSIEIHEAQRIGRIVVPGSGSNPDPKTSEILYVLLTDSEFRALTPDMFIDVPAANTRNLCMPRLHGMTCDANNLPMGACEEKVLPYVTASQLAEWQAALQELGYSIVTISEPARPGELIGPIDLQAQPLAKDSGQSGKSEARPRASKQAIPTTVSHSVERSARVSGASEPVTPAKPDNVPPAPDQPQYAFGVSAIFRPSQPVRVLGLFQPPKVNLPAFLGGAPASLSVAAGSDGTNPVGQGSFSADYLWFNHLRRRLSASLNYGTDAISSRILEGISTDQRQTGPSARLDLELVHSLHGWRLTSYAAPISQSISLSPQGGTQANAYVNELTAGLTLNYENWMTFHPVLFIFTPEVSWANTAGQSNFWKFSADSSVHVRIVKSLLISLQIHGRFGFASTQTPVFTVPSLGGADSVRGFREDDALGRSLWSLQNEVWLPVPGTLKTTNANGIQKFLRKNIRIATFYDVGNAQSTNVNPFPLTHSTASGQFVPGIRQGAGIGLRFIQPPIALKLDWAYGFGPSVSGADRGRAYLGASTSGAF